MRKKHSKNFVITHINVNSLQNKFDELRTLLDNNLVDCLFISETKLNSSHTSQQFQVDNYQLYRKDNPHNNGGGLACFIRSDIPSYAEEFDSHPCENLTIIANIDNEKWAFIGTYRRPSINQNFINNKLDPLIDKFLTIAKNVVVLGDLNCDMLKEGSNAVKTLCEDLNLVNCVNKPTCYKAKQGTLLDVILVNDVNTVKHCDVSPCNLSDFHLFVTLVLNKNIMSIGKKCVSYRSYKHFNEQHFRNEIESTPFHAGECLDPEDQCHFFRTLFNEVLEKHAPVKTKVIRRKQNPFMNSEWKRALFRKHQLYNKYWRCKTQSNWSNYRKQRNLCQKLKRASIRNYMNEKCKKAKSEPKEFWKMVSPLLSDKSKDNNSIQLLEGDRLISSPTDVAELFNERFTTIADDIGKGSKFFNDTTNHPSFELINEHMRKTEAPLFQFRETTVDETRKVLSTLNPNKAVGYDNIPAKALRSCSELISPAICNLANNILKSGSFPICLKKAEVVPIYKSKSKLQWKNFRPVSVLTSISKVMETIMMKQMQPHLERVYSPYLSAYRKDYGCHSVLMHTTEMWKQALDNGNYVGIIMSDLSKAFDCLPHNLLLEKIRLYNFSQSALDLLQNYLSDRLQRVKIGQNLSQWKPLRKGVPQGSVIGPHCFNLYINDLLLALVKDNIIPSNYADDNSSSVIGKSKSEVLQKVESTFKLLKIWFEDNLMKANSDKFQFMLLCPSIAENRVDHLVTIDNFTLHSQEEAKLLGVLIDRDLTLNGHVISKCKQANSKLAILKRLTTYLSNDCKISILRNFIVAHFVYCAPLLHFCSKSHRDKMEKILLRGLRFVFEEYDTDFEILLDKANMCSLQISREKAILCELFKCLKGLGPKYMSEIFTLSKRESRNGPSFEQPRTRTTRFGTHSLRSIGPKLWNELPKEYKESLTIEQFKIKLKKYSGKGCKCNLCK